MPEPHADPDNLDHAKLVTVFECPDEPGAALRVHVLADAGIRAVAVGGLTAGLRAEAPGWVAVKVMEGDADEAKRVLSEVRRVEPGDVMNDEDDDEPLDDETT